MKLLKRLQMTGAWGLPWSAWQSLIRLTTITWLTTVVIGCSGQAQSASCSSSVPYGNNPAAGHYATVNGIRLYYEIYGSGPALLLMHGNGGSIARMACQIAFFAPTHTVIAVDGRGRGKSEDGTIPYTFELQADDFAALLEHEHVDQADLLGQSDGGIIALVMSLRHPDKVRKVIASAPNLWPDSTALYPEVIDGMKDDIAEINEKLAEGDNSDDWARYKRQLEEDLDEPHITLEQVRTITVPTLLIGATDDAIRPEHLRDIESSLPCARLFIIPGTTHGGLLHAAQFNQLAAQFLTPGNDADPSERCAQSLAL